MRGKNPNLARSATSSLRVLVNFLDAVADNLLVELAHVERHQVLNEVEQNLSMILAIRGS
jgi:hypothetical protein